MIKIINHRTQTLRKIMKAVLLIHKQDYIYCGEKQASYDKPVFFPHIEIQESDSFESILNHLLTKHQNEVELKRNINQHDIYFRIKDIVIDDKKDEVLVLYAHYLEQPSKGNWQSKERLKELSEGYGVISGTLDIPDHLELLGACYNLDPMTEELQGNILYDQKTTQFHIKCEDKSYTHRKEYLIDLINRHTEIARTNYADHVVEMNFVAWTLNQINALPQLSEEMKKSAKRFNIENLNVELHTTLGWQWPTLHSIALLQIYIQGSVGEFGARLIDALSIPYTEDPEETEEPEN